jgi:hypothetical protein
MKGSEPHAGLIYLLVGMLTHFVGFSSRCRSWVNRGSIGRTAVVAKAALNSCPAAGLLQREAQPWYWLGSSMAYTS